MSFDSILHERPQTIQQIAKQLREWIRQTDKRIEENIYGGAKVKLALYSIGHTNNVLYGIQPADKYCTLYFHHTDKADTFGLKLEGKGKHAKHVKITSLDEAIEEKIKGALSGVLTVSGY